MKLKLQSIDTGAQDQQSLIHHLQSSSNFFTEKPIPVAAGNQIETFGGGRLEQDNVFQGNAEMRETILRKLEKERLREAIIAEEVARRRLLEAEVRKELMMDHEIAVRSGGRIASPFMHPSPSSTPAVGLEKKLEMPINEKYGNGGHRRELLQLLDDSPQIKSPVEDKQGVAVVLEDNDNTLSGNKRKSPPPAYEGSSKPASERPKKKVKEEWECAICQVTATSEVSFNQHVQGKKHHAKEADFLAQRTGANVGLGVAPKKPAIVQPVNLTLTAINQTNSGAGEEKSEPVKKPVDLQTPVLNKTSSASDLNGLKKHSEKKKDDYLFWCEICQVGAFFEAVMNDHKQGKKHLARLQLYRKSKVDCEGSSTENARDTKGKTEG